MPLTDKQQRFCEEYIVDLNATKAAIRAGYSEKTANNQVGRLLVNVGIQEEIKRLQNKVSEKTELNAAWVLNNLKDVAERCMQAQPVLFRNGEPKITTDKDGQPKAAYVFDSAGANRALELIGKHLGLFTERMEITDGVKIIRDTIAEKLKAKQNECS